jgi:hypothetical protein
VRQYKHTQPGTLMRVSFGCIIAFTLGLAVWAGRHEPQALPLFSFISLAMGIGLVLFHQLTVTVSKDFIRLRFGIGVVHKKFAIAEVESAVAVQKKWWNGWGIRITSHGWLYNVSGYDAVEIQFKDGKMASIGTDEPKRLLAAIEAVIR